MSLINEALKRARVEAARRDAAEKGVPPSALPVYVPRRRRPWLAPLVGFATGLLAVGVAGGAFWLVRRPTSPENPSVAAVEARGPAMEVTAAPATATPEATMVMADPRTTPPAAPIEETAAAPPPSGSGSPLRKRGVRGDSPPVATMPPPAPIEETAAAALPPSGSGSSSRPATRAPEAQRRARGPAPGPSDELDGQTFLRQVEPPGGKPVKVGFIVWSAAPFASVNGQLLSPGQSVDGYTLLAVERDRVELEGGGGRFWIRVK